MKKILSLGITCLILSACGGESTSQTPSSPQKDKVPESTEKFIISGVYVSNYTIGTGEVDKHVVIIGGDKKISTYNYLKDSVDNGGDCFRPTKPNEVNSHISGVNIAYSGDSNEFVTVGLTPEIRWFGSGSNVLKISIGGSLSTSDSLVFESSDIGRLSLSTQRSIFSEAEIKDRICDLTVDDSPKITQLSFDGDLSIDSTLYARSSCTNCDQHKLSYRWTVDRNGNGVFGDTAIKNGVEIADVHSEGNTYIYKEQDFSYAVRLDLTYDLSELNVPNLYESFSRKPVVVKNIYSNANAYVALKNNGSIVVWGDAEYGGDHTSVKDTVGNVAEIYSTRGAFAAVNKDSEVITWGNVNYGGDSTLVKEKLLGIKDISSTEKAFAALKNDGTVITWGDPRHGGDSSNVQELLKNVKHIYSNRYSFAALLESGELITWGHAFYGGDSTAVKEQLSNVKNVYSTYGSFIAVTDSGHVAIWGPLRPNRMKYEQLKNIRNPKEIITNAHAVAILKSDDSVVTFGNLRTGGNSDEVQESLTQVKTVVGNYGAFAALKHNGAVVTWGNGGSGGDSSSVKDQLVGVKSIVASQQSFAALKDDGTVIAWNSSSYGGNYSITNNWIKVSKLYSSHRAFLALYENSAAEAWTNKYGEGIQGPIHKVFVAYSNFYLLKDNGDVISWLGSSNAIEDLSMTEVIESSIN